MQIIANARSFSSDDGTVINLPMRTLLFAFTSSKIIAEYDIYAAGHSRFNGVTSYVTVGCEW